ncbi:MAG: DnaJ domain-containing protein [Candidatus Obscuribacterales bacterium]|nr:DnaJ domain-containing protein [Candidatus Obscuribacterales bacterium]
MVEQSKTQTQKDYYYILGVRPDATSREIQSAYEQLYEKFGPHVNISGMDPDIMIKNFREICDAYEVLMDPKMRQEYDRNSAQLRQSMGDLRNLWQKSADKPQEHSGMNTSGIKAAALAVELECEITLKEAMKGCTREIRLSDPRPCEHCNAMKTVNRMQCQNCRGLGYFNVERVTDVDLPAGTYDGMEIRRPGCGRYDIRAKSQGDLILKVKILPHPVLGVLGRDITVTVPVTLYEALLGAEIEIPTASGKVVMKIQPLTHPGRVYRLKGLGLAGADQLVTIDVVFPQKMSPEEMALLAKMKELAQETSPRDGLWKTQQTPPPSGPIS